MTIHKEGTVSILITLLFVIVLNILVSWLAPNILLLHWLSWALSAFLIIIILQFFRNPKRELILSEHGIIAPADGKVVVIEEVMEGEYLKDKRIQLSIFMSPLNVHINRNPIGGIVKYFKYHPGLYLVAWHPKSSTENERTTVVIEHSNKSLILFRQIAGAMARRIVWYLKEGETVAQAQEMGFIKFGSRVDLLLPLNAKIKVTLGQAVKGGQTLIAEL